MTSYFSIQIQELEGVYTVKTYWVSFAIIMVLSFVALFMFSRVLVGVGSVLDARLKKSIDHLMKWSTSSRTSELSQHR